MPLTPRRFTWDEAKRERTLADRGIDFADLAPVFDDPAAVFVEDVRRDYGEDRVIVLGRLADRLHVVGFVDRGTDTHIFSARKANAREQRRFYG